MHLENETDANALNSKENILIHREKKILYLYMYAAKQLH